MLLRYILNLVPSADIGYLQIIHRVLHNQAKAADTSEMEEIITLNSS